MDTMTCDRLMWLRSVLIHDSTKVITTFSRLSMCWVSTHGSYCWKPRVKMRWLQIAKIIRDDGRCLKNLQTDMGKEFYNAKTLEKIQYIYHYSTLSSLFSKTSVVERFYRTLKNDMWKQFTYNGNYKWIDLLSRPAYLSTTRESIELSIYGLSTVTLTIADVRYLYRLRHLVISSNHIDKESINPRDVDC